MKNVFVVALVSLLAVSQAFAAKDANEPNKPKAKEKPKMSQTDPNAKPTQAANPVVEMVTSKGTILIELDSKKAPITTENFVKYVKDGFFNGTVFHRVIPDFMIQGGGFTPDMQQKKTRTPIKNEASNGLLNSRGTIAMARTPDPDSATAQFFINLKDNSFLNYQGRGNPGYAVFGKVTKGMEVVDSIAKVKTGQKGMHGDVPLETVTITSVKVIEPNEAPKK